MKPSQFIKENYAGFEDEFTDSELLDIKDCMKDYSEQESKELLKLLDDCIYYCRFESTNIGLAQRIEQLFKTK